MIKSIHGIKTRLVSFFLVVLVLGIGEQQARAASPSLGSISPRGAQRGTDALFVLSGARLSDTKEILYYQPGFTTSKLEIVNDNQIKLTVKIAPDVLPGEYALRLRAASGISELRTFWVGALPVVEEKEPNNDFAAPQKVSLNCTVHGVANYEDVDYYAVDLKKGQRLSVEIEGMRLATTNFDPFIAILDSKRFELATSDDHPLLKQDGMCSIIAPADGTYFVQVRESAYRGNGSCLYRLHIGTFPRPRAVIPAGGKAGEEVEVTFLGDPRGPFKQKVKIPATPGADFGIHPQDAEGIAPSAIPFRISDVGNVVEVEPNDTHDTATRGDFPMAYNGVIEKAGDEDWFRFKGKKGQTYDVRCYARQLGSPLDPIMTLSVAGGGAIASNDDSGGPDSYFRVTIPDEREYVIGVKDHLGKGGPTYFYRIEFTPVKPTARVSIPKVAQFSQDRQSISVPRGGRMATLVNVGRANFGGELQIIGEKLPPGVVMHLENMAANLDVVPIVFEAPLNANVSGGLGKLVAKHADPKHPPVESSYSQTAELIIGNPGQSVYWRYDFERLAMAVTDEVPYSIEVVEPKVPLVQSGSMQLKIIAKRKPGFTAPITVYPLFNPPGVNTTSSATIPANGTETVLPMNAAGNAQVRKWKTAIVAQADAGKGPMWTSSQLYTLEVAAPFVAVNLQRSAVERGQETEMVCKLQQLTAFDGKAKIRLIGLPFKVTAPEMEITKDSKEIFFKITTDPTSPAGNHRNLFCQIVITKNGEPIVANSGSSELRIDVPIVKTTPAPPKPTTPAVKPPTPPTPPKRLSRLEQLRKDQEEREKAAKGGTTPPKK